MASYEVVGRGHEVPMTQKATIGFNEQTCYWSPESRRITGAGPLEAEERGNGQFPAHATNGPNELEKAIQ